jgi:ribosomal protein L12E/L44/L45/RPP1/RPP2
LSDDEEVMIEGEVSPEALLEALLDATRERGPVAAEELHELINDVTSEASLALLDRFVSALTGMSVEELVEAAARGDAVARPHGVGATLERDVSPRAARKLWRAVRSAMDEYEAGSAGA